MAFPQDLENDSRFKNLLDENVQLTLDLALNTHVNTLRIQERLGYPINMRGCCFGYAVVSLFAAMQNKLDYLDKDISIIGRMGQTEEDIAWYKQLLKMEPWNNDARKAQTNLNFALSRLEQLHLLHDPSEHREIFNAFFDNKGPYIRSQGSHIKEAEKLYSAKKSENEINLLNRTCCPYSEQEFIESMQLFEKACQSSGDRVGILLETEAHTISCVYDPKEKEWIFSDFYNPPPQHVKNIEELAASAWKGISRYEEEPVVISTQVFTTRNNEAELTKSLGAWNKNQNELIRAEKLERLDYTKKRDYLTVASRADYPEIVELILKLPSLQDEDFLFLSRAFYVACQNGNIDIVNKLLLRGADVNYKISGISPLFGAITAGQVGVVNLLIDKGAVVNTANHDELTPLYIAANRGDMEIFNLLLKRGAELEYKNTSGVTALYMAVLNEDYRTALILLKNGADPNCCDSRGVSALTVAAAKDNVTMINMLSAFGASMNIRDNMGQTPLYIAGKNHQYAAMDLLLKRQSDINATNKDGMTLLHLAVQKNDTELIEYLITSGADMNIPNPITHETPLLLAINKNRIEMANILLSNNADPNVQSEGKTALDTAVDNFRDDIAELLLARNAVSTISLGKQVLHQMLLTALDNNRFHTVRWLVGLGADINFKNNEGETFLIMVAEDRDVECAKLLCSLGADLDVIRNDGKSALYFAASSGNLEMVKLVFSEKVMDKQIKMGGMSPLLIAAKNGHAEVVSYLLTNGADPNIADSKGRTAIDFAREYERSNVLKVLEEFKLESKKGIRNQ